MTSTSRRAVAAVTSALYLGALSGCAIESGGPEQQDILAFTGDGGPGQDSGYPGGQDAGYPGGQDAGYPGGQDAGPILDAGWPGDGGVCTDDFCYECEGGSPPVAPGEEEEVEFAYNVWDLDDPNSGWPGCGSCGANNSYLSCATNCCACNLTAAAGIAAVAVAWPTIAALGGLVTEAGLAAFGALTGAEVLAGITAMGAAAAAFKPWANACLKCYCNVELRFN